MGAKCACRDSNSGGCFDPHPQIEKGPLQIPTRMNRGSAGEWFGVEEGFCR